MQISARCYALTGLGYVVPWSVNAGFIVGSEATLIVDTGACALSAATIHGYAVAARPGNRLAVINTERHFDHVGGNSYFRDRGVDVFGHVKLQRTAEQFRDEMDEFNRAIANPVRRRAGEANAFFAGTRLENPNRAIASDTSMDLGDCPIEILLTPGHTPTNVSVWVPDDGVLYCGDCLISGYMPNLDAGGRAEWREWLESIDRIEALRAAAVMAGHGPVAKGAEVEQMIARARGFLEEAIRKGHSPTSERAAGQVLGS